MNAFRTIEISDPCFERDGLKLVTVKSRALKMRGDVTLWVPPGPLEGAKLAILLHGVYGSHWAWAWKGGAHTTAAELTAAGEIGPMILAMPSDGLWGDGSGYQTHRGQDFERWIMEEVPLVVQQVLGVDPGRFFLCGLSMGGYGAMRLAARYPERCRGVSAHSSATEVDQLQEVVEEVLGDSYVDQEGVGAAWLKAKGPLPPLRFDCGRDDFLLEANRELHRQLEAAGIAHVYEEFEGAHEWSYWRRHVANSLRFFGGMSQIDS